MCNMKQNSHLLQISVNIHTPWDLGSSSGYPKASFYSISVRQRLNEAAFISYSIGGAVMLKNIPKYNCEYSLSFTTKSSTL